MTDFIRGGLSSSLDFTAAAWSDTHSRTTLTNSARCVTNLALFKTHFLQQQFDCSFHAGDIVDESGGLAAIDDIVSSSGKPCYKARGNHDYWATNAQLGIPDPGYYTQDLGTKWRLIVLDSTEGGSQTNSGQYKLGATQKTWMENELIDALADGKYVVIMLHVPIGGFAPLKYEVRQDADDPVLAGSFNPTKDMMMDQYTLGEAFNTATNVKLVISGHWHLKDWVEDRGLIHYDPGAISGNFWQNPLTLYGEPPSYGKLNFFKDGTVAKTNLYYPFSN